MKGFLRFLTIIAVLAMVATACGDSGSSGLGDAPTATSDSPFGDAGTIPVTVGNLPGVSGECEALLNVFLGFAGAFTGGFQTPDLGALSGLPGDLQDDAAVMVGALQDFADGLDDLGIDLSDPTSLSSMTEAQQQALADLSDAFDSDAFNEAADNLSAYGEAECGQFGDFGN